MKKFNKYFTILVFIFLYIPMIVLAVASFSSNKDIAVFESFTLHQYKELFRDDTLLSLLGNSLIISVLATLCATVLGTVAALGIHKSRGRLRSAIMTLTNIPMTNPEIVTGSDFVTLPVEIYSYTKKPIHPKVYALFTLIFLAILVLMVTMNLLQLRDSSRRRKNLERRVAR